MRCSHIDPANKERTHRGIRHTLAADDGKSRPSHNRHSHLLAAVAALAVALSFALPFDNANAQGAACGLRDSIVERLKIGYKESEAGYGLTGSGMMAELFVSETGSWTIIVTRPDGISCLVAAGHSWEMTPITTTEAEPDPAS